MKLMILKSIFEEENYLKIQEVKLGDYANIFGDPQIVRKKEDPICYSLGVCPDLKRKKESVEYVTGFVFDFDNTNNDKLVNYSDLSINYSHVAHTTFSHSFKKPKFRVIVPFNFELTSFDYFEDAWLALLFEMCVRDKNKILACDKSSSQYWRNNFFPSCSKFTKEHFTYWGGSLLDHKLDYYDYDDFAQRGVNLSYPEIIHKETGKVLSNESRHDVLISKGFEICSNAKTKEDALEKFNQFISENIEEPYLFLKGGKRYRETMRGFNQGWKMTEDNREANKISLDFLTSKPEEEEVFEIENAPEITKDLLDEAPRLVKDIIDFLHAKQASPPAFLLGCAQEILSMSKGRSVLFHPLKSHPPMRACCYNLYIGDSGVGKGATLRLPKLTFDEVFDEPQYRSQLFNFKRESFSRSVASVTGLRNKLQESGLLMLKVDEYGEKMLKNLKAGFGHQAEIDDYLLELYGADEVSPQAKSKGNNSTAEPDLISPLFCFSGTTTPSIFLKMQDASIFAKGSMSRMNLYYHFDKTVQPRTFRPFDEVGKDPRSQSFNLQDLIKTDYPVLSDFAKETIIEGFVDVFKLDPNFRQTLTEVRNRYISLSKEAYELLVETSLKNEEHSNNSTSENVKILHSRYFQKLLAMCNAFSYWDSKRQAFYLDAETTVFCIKVQRILHKISLAILEKVTVSSYMEDRRNMSLQEKQVRAMIEVLEMKSYRKTNLAKALKYSSHNDRNFKKTFKILEDKNLIEIKKHGRVTMIHLKQ